MAAITFMRPALPEPLLLHCIRMLVLPCNVRALFWCSLLTFPGTLLAPVIGTRSAILGTPCSAILGTPCSPILGTPCPIILTIRYFELTTHDPRCSMLTHHWYSMLTQHWYSVLTHPRCSVLKPSYVASLHRHRAAETGGGVHHATPNDCPLTPSHPSHRWWRTSAYVSGTILPKSKSCQNLRPFWSCMYA